MVLLKGLNYDFSGQQNTILSSDVNKNSTIIIVDSPDGFVANDYLILDPQKENAEVIKITSITSNQIIVSSLVFFHSKGCKVYKTPYNQMNFYKNGVAVSGGTGLSMTYDSIYTNYQTTDLTGSFQRTFYNSTTTSESDITLSEAWTVTDENYDITSDELRAFLQFDTSDMTYNDLLMFIGLADSRMSLDIVTNNKKIRKIAMLMLSKYYVLRGLATKSVSKGYITINAEGRSITKAYQELVLEAKDILDEYQLFIRENLTQEVTSTNFMTSVEIDSDTRQTYIDYMNGTQNAMDFNNLSKTQYGRVRRYSS